MSRNNIKAAIDKIQKNAKAKHIAPALPLPPLLPLPLEEGIGIILVSADLQGVWMNLRLAGAKDHQGYHQVAGGSVDPGESPRQAAVRELYEETGIVADPKQLTQVIRKVYSKPSGSIYRSTQFAMITPQTPENTEPHKHSEWELIPWVTIPKLRCFGAVKEIFQTS